MRYIDADALYKKLYPLDLADKRKYTINAKAVADAIANIPTADVVPKSEVEALGREIERLKKSMLPSYYSACSEEEAIKIGKQYGRTEVAREIFAEIESVLCYSVYPRVNKNGTIKPISSKDWRIRCDDYNAIKKKYTEESK